jgi:hypothetical protein
MPTQTKSTRRKTAVKNSRQTARPRNRIKLSTTVAAENFTFLESLVSAGRAESIAEAVDLAIARLRRIENRARLESATVAYFESLTPQAQREEQSLARQLHLSAKGLDFDREP